MVVEHGVEDADVSFAGGGVGQEDVKVLLALVLDVIPGDFQAGGAEAIGGEDAYKLE
ncbi:hypothetical protein WDZ92_11595 [Nostoc sp. NIES-2111]